MKYEDMYAGLLGMSLPGFEGEILADIRRDVARHRELRKLLRPMIAPPPPPEQESLLPRLPKRFRIVGEIGRGRNGVVYGVTDEANDRSVAVKVFRPGEPATDRAVKTYYERAGRVARLDDSSILHIHTAGCGNGELYQVTNFVPGESLAGVLRRGRPSLSQTLTIISDVVSAIARAHEHRVTHLNLKPSNILLHKGGFVYVTDFDLTRDLLDMPDAPAPIRAPRHSAKEDRAADLRALGAILYEMLTGRAPVSDGPPAVGTLVPPRRIDRRIPRAIEAICLAALGMGRRYRSVEAFDDDLCYYRGGLRPDAYPPAARRTS